MAVVFAILTAISNAVAVATQHIASTSEAGRSSGRRLIAFLIHHPLWLAGWVAMAGSLVFQATALHFGPLSIVQPLLVTELVVALALRRIWLRQTIRAITWWAALVTGVGLVSFLVATSPSGGDTVPSASKWLTSSIVVAAGAAALLLAGKFGTPARRAALFASATAMLWALEATFIKSSTDVLTSFGVSGLFVRWPLYALIGAGLIGLWTEQAALHVGPLSVSQPIIVIVDPVVSVALGVWLYRERLHPGAWHYSIGACAFAVMCVGIVVLTRSAPPTMSSEIHRL